MSNLNLSLKPCVEESLASDSSPVSAFLGSDFRAGLVSSSEWQNLVKNLMNTLFVHIRNWRLDPLHVEGAYRERHEILRKSLDAFGLLGVFEEFSGLTLAFGPAFGDSKTLMTTDGVDSFDKKDTISLRINSLEASLRDFIALGLLSKKVSLLAEKTVSEFNQAGWVSGVVLAITGVNLYGPGGLGKLFVVFHQKFDELKMDFITSLKTPLTLDALNKFFRQLDAFNLENLEGELLEENKKMLEALLREGLGAQFPELMRHTSLDSVIEASDEEGSETGILEIPEVVAKSAIVLGGTSLDARSHEGGESLADAQVNKVDVALVVGVSIGDSLLERESVGFSRLSESKDFSGKLNSKERRKERRADLSNARTRAGTVAGEELYYGVGDLD